MGKLEISESLYKELMAVRQDVRDKFDALRIDGHANDRTGKQRLESVPSLRSREFEKYLKGAGAAGAKGEVKKQKAAWKIYDFLTKNDELTAYAKSGIRSEIESQLNQLRQSQSWLGTAERLGEALGVSRLQEASATESAIAVSVPQVGKNVLPGSELATPPPSPGDDQEPPRPVDTPMGKSTGSRENHVDDLCYAEAEWRDTNLGPDEGRWLQLLLRFEKSHTRDRARNIERNLYLHRIRVEAILDGGQAATRVSWTENASAGGGVVEIRQGNAWTGTRPCYDIDNPVRNTPLSGHYDWFDLCEVTGAVGNNALLEISASIGGISISLSDEIRDQLDPNKGSPHDTPELHLIEGWLRNQLVPTSRLKGGGRYQLTQIELKKGS